MPGGTLVPANDLEADKLTKFKTGEMYPVEIKQFRNIAFHRKAFAFFNFCFEHWCSENQYQSENKQFDVFRAHMTVLAGFYDEYHGIDGRCRVEAKSIAFGNMSPEEFEELYSALINVALQKIFKTADENTYYQLLSFF